MLVIITNKEDFTADFLISELIKRKLPYFRLNSEELAEIKVNATFNSDFYNATIQLEERTIDLSGIQSIWYRRSIFSHILQNISQESKRFIRGEIQHLFEGLLIDDNIQWVNPFDSVIKAERKLYQLKIASSIGFTIPNSLISCDSEEITKFIDSNNRTICKPIYHGLFLDKNDDYAIYTNRVCRQDIDSKILKYPTYFQEEIKKISDIRVTVVGNDIFSVEIIKNKEQTPDWRHKSEKPIFKKTHLPKKIDELCLNLLSSLNLKYGAIDLVKLNNDKYVFLEINPTGEWAWLEHELDLPIRDSLIKLFFQYP